MKKGDFVVRIRDTHNGMCVGDCAYVIYVSNDSVILDNYMLVDNEGLHSAHNLKVITEEDEDILTDLLVDKLVEELKGKS